MGITKYIVIIMSADVQTQKAFQKQHGLTLVSNKHKLTSRKSKTIRYYKNVGLGYKTPKGAIDGNYIDKKCPFTGNVSIRGRVLKGIVLSTKMKNTIVVRKSFLHFIRKYNRFEKRHSNIPSHCSPCFKGIKEGDIVTIGQCRPLSKTVRFNVLKHQPNQIFGSAKKQFMLF